MYEDYNSMRYTLSKLHQNILKSALPKHFVPMVFAVTGTGRVAHGILEVLEQLPHEKVDPDDLKNLKSTDTRKIIISNFEAKHLVRHKDGKPFDKKDYYANPNEYEAKFYEYLPYVTWLINGIYWEAKYPRILTIDELRDAQADGTCRLLGVCDISADYQGSIEFTSRFTSIEEPFLLWDAQKAQFYEKISQSNENCILFHSVDHLPAEMPKEASNHFGEKLFPFAKAVVNSDPSLPFSQMNDIPPEINNAIICCHGELTPNFYYIMKMREFREQTQLAEEEYKQTLKESVRKTSTLRRGMRFTTVVFTGHLFDTQFFNRIVEILNEFDLDFRIIEWEVGNSSTSPSTVTVQIVAQNPESMDKAIDLVEKECEKHNVKVYEGSGPGYEDIMPKLIHQES